MTASPRPGTRADGDEGAECALPAALRFAAIGAMLNAELADHPVYDGFELQRFDDAAHGSGMVAFLSRREDRSVDYYVTRGLAVDRAGYVIGGGIRSWNEIDFDSSSLAVHDDGVVAHVGFTDVDGRAVTIDIDDRDGRRRNPGALLAPVGAGIERPASLMLVWMPRFDLVRAVAAGAPSVRIDGHEAAIGRLPGAALHRRHLIKYAAPVLVAEFNRDGDDAAAGGGGVGTAEPGGGAGEVRRVSAVVGDSTARVEFRPPAPALAGLRGEEARTGAWRLGVDDAWLTGGTWFVRAGADRIEVGLDVFDRWRPRRLPLLMRIVTWVMPVFRAWPTTYRWRAALSADGRRVLEARWERTETGGGDAYRRATRS